MGFVWHHWTRSRNQISLKVLDILCLPDKKLTQNVLARYHTIKGKTKKIYTTSFMTEFQKYIGWVETDIDTDQFGDRL